MCRYCIRASYLNQQRMTFDDMFSTVSRMQGSVVFVCGSASRMPQDVLQAFQDVLKQEAGMTAEEAAKYMKQLELKGRYITEAWS